MSEVYQSDASDLPVVGNVSALQAAGHKPGTLRCTGRAAPFGGTSKTPEPALDAAVAVPPPSEPGALEMVQPRGAAVKRAASQVCASRIPYDKAPSGKDPFRNTSSVAYLQRGRRQLSLVPAAFRAASASLTAHQFRFWGAHAHEGQFRRRQHTKHTARSGGHVTKLNGIT